MSRKRKYSSLYFQLFRGNLIGILIVLFLVLVRLAQSVQRSVPDMSGLSFWFTTPLCSTESPANMHVIPQTTRAVNVTIVSLDASVTIDNGLYTIESSGVLYIPLPCVSVTWGQIDSSGLIVTSTSEVIIYVDYADDSHVVLPVDVTSTEYILTSPTVVDYSVSYVIIHGNTSVVQFEVPDKTQSNIQIEGTSYGPGSTANISLPVNGVLAISCSCDLTGAKVTSDLPVFILTGAKKSSSQTGFIEATFPEGTWGRKFLFPTHSWISDNVTLVITGKKLQTGITITTSGTSRNVVFTDAAILTFQLQLTDFLSIDSNTSISCALVYSIKDKSSVYHTAFRYITPIALYHIRYRYKSGFNNNEDLSANVIAKQGSFKYFTFNSTSIEPFQQVMTFVWDYFLSKNIEVSSPGSVVTSDQNNVPLHGSVFRRNSTVAYEYVFDMRIVNIYDACVNSSKAYGGNGDGIDNDCDNLIDEEILNKIDDDKDGLIDEDVRYAGNVGQPHRETVLEYHIRNAIKEPEGLSVSLISIVISIGVALTSVLCFIGGMLLFEKIRRSSSSTRVTPIF